MCPSTEPIMKVDNTIFINGDQFVNLNSNLFPQYYKDSMKATAWEMKEKQRKLTNKNE